MLEFRLNWNTLYFLYSLFSFCIKERILKKNYTNIDIFFSKICQKRFSIISFFFPIFLSHFYLLIIVVLIYFRCFFCNLQFSCLISPVICLLFFIRQSKIIFVYCFFICYIFFTMFFFYIINIMFLYILFFIYFIMFSSFSIYILLYICLFLSFNFWV